MGRPNKGNGTVGPKRPGTNNGSNTNGNCKSSYCSKKK